MGGHLVRITGYNKRSWLLCFILLVRADMLRFEHGTWWNSRRWALIDTGHRVDLYTLSSVHFRLAAQILQIRLILHRSRLSIPCLQQLLVSQYSPHLLWSHITTRHKLLTPAENRTMPPSPTTKTTDNVTQKLKAHSTPAAHPSSSPTLSISASSPFPSPSAALALDAGDTAFLQVPTIKATRVTQSTHCVSQATRRPPTRRGTRLAASGPPFSAMTFETPARAASLLDIGVGMVPLSTIRRIVGGGVRKARTTTCSTSSKAMGDCVRTRPGIRSSK